MDHRAGPGTSAGDALLERLLTLPLVGAAELSPDGRWVAWSWSGPAPTPQVHLAPTDGSALPRRLTEGSANAQLLGWAAAGDRLVIAATEGGDERVRLLLAGPDLAPRSAVEAAPGEYIVGGALDAAGGRLVYAANVDPETGALTETFQVIAHDVAAGVRRALARPRRPGRTAPQLDPGGRDALYSRADRHPEGRQLWLAALDGGEDRPIVDAGERAKASGSWSPDGAAVVVVAETPSHRRLGLWRRADGGLDWLIDDPTRDIAGAWWPAGSDRIVVRETRQGRSLCRLVDPASGAEEAVGSPEGTLIPLGPTPTGDWIGRLYSGAAPDDLVRFVPGPAASTASLTRAGRGSDPALVRPSELRWRSVDAQPVQGWHYRAPGRARGTVVSVHGGPTHHSEDRFNPLIQFLLAQGFDVLDPNYRGSTGFGLAFQQAIKQEGWGGLEQEDIRAGVRALIEAGLAVPGRVGITGVSYGGYSAWCAITRFPTEEIAAAAPVCGMTDLVVDYETTRPDIRTYSEEMMGGSPATAPERYRERSPIHFVERIRGRLLIVQGLTDPNVTAENVAAVRRALDEAGIAYELLTFPDEGHGIVKRANRAVLYRRLAAFFAAAFGE
jgi:dipeptidyl aminopeptidase/acylaminoacyl peptidase